MQTIKFLIKLGLFCVPFLGLVALPFYLGELMPVQVVVQQQQSSEQDFIYGPQFVWRDNLFAYRVETINQRKPEVLVLGSSRTTNFRSQMFDRNPGTFYNASVEGFNIVENEQLLYSINPNALPKTLLLGMNQNLFKTENVLLEANRPTQLWNEIPLEEFLSGTIFRMFEDILTDGDFVRLGLGADLIYPETTHLGTRLYTFGHGYLADGSTRNRVVEEWSRGFITQETRRDTEELLNREAKFRPGETVNQEYLAIVEGMLQYAQEHEIQVIGFLPPFAPEFYEELVASDDFDYIFAASRELAQLFGDYNAFYFDFTNPYYFQLGDRNFRDSWHASDYIMAQVVQIMAWASPSTFDPYVAPFRLADAITDTTDPNIMFFEGADDIIPPTRDPIGQLIEAEIQWDPSLLIAARAYNRARFSPSDDYDILAQNIGVSIERYPNLAPLYLWRAQAYFRGEQSNLLVNDVATALRLDPTIDVPLHLLGGYLVNSGAEGRRQIDDVISRNPDAGWAYMARGDLFFSNENYQRASKDYLAAYQLDRSIESRDGYIASLIELEDVGGVLAFMNSAFQGTDNDLDILEQRAEVYTQLELYDEAIRDYQRAYDLTDRTNPTYIVRQGDVYAQAEQYDLAITTYESAAERLANPGYVYTRIGDVYTANDQADTALDFYLQSIETSPDGVLGYARVMDYYATQDNYQEAINYATQAIENGNGEAWIYGRRGRYYRAEEQYDAALDDFLVMSTLEPDDLSHHYFVGDMYFQLEQFEKAQIWLERAITIDAPTIGTFVRLADIYQLNDDLDSAIVIMRQAISQYPEEEWLRDRLARYIAISTNSDGNLN